MVPHSESRVFLNNAMRRGKKWNLILFDTVKLGRLN